MRSMSATRKLAEFDLVELTEAVDDAPAGARGGVLEFTNATTAMVEVLTPDLGSLDRIVFAPVSVLRRVASAR
jgi:methylaspartate ammonia-lyase